MTRSQFLGLLTLPFVGKLLPKEETGQGLLYQLKNNPRTLSERPFKNLSEAIGKLKPTPPEWANVDFRNVDPKELNFDLGSMEIPEFTNGQLIVPADSPIAKILDASRFNAANRIKKSTF